MIAKKLKSIKSKRDALAAHLSLDFSETEDYRYHYGHTSQPVWAFDSAYYCVTRMKQRPAKHKNGLSWDWYEVHDAFLNDNGYKIWKADVISE